MGSATRQFERINEAHEPTGADKQQLKNAYLQNYFEPETRELLKAKLANEARFASAMPAEGPGAVANPLRNIEGDKTVRPPTSGLFLIPHPRFIFSPEFFEPIQATLRSLFTNAEPMHDDCPFTRAHALIIAVGILIGYLVTTRLF